ncbi:arsenate reductase family protein [Sediminitomix flava]|uniref:Arsenate reductase n=1 Tax=Sediminitomix flava TaxID=379075 RepID=A0A315ZFZ7_SEDFL|nr:ArsC/Spx/MgsR family protein [Sediminitomix flava]PWJ44516.1 arsenate reductase [Sediminitomix flava]
MRKVYLLSSCSTCQRIVKEAEIPEGVEIQDIKTENITLDQLESMKEKVGSYESLFSRRAMKYKEWGLKEKALTEEDYKNYILEEYTFLKRPVIFWDDQIFVGNAKKTVEALKEAVATSK